MNNVEMAVVENKDTATYKIVSDPVIARKLIKLGYRVADIKPKKNFNRETAFVFAVEGEFMAKMGELIAEKTAKRNAKAEPEIE